MPALQERRDTILFYDYIGMPTTEIAKTLGLSEKTVTQSLQEPVLKHRTVFFVSYMDTSAAIINKITNTVQGRKTA